MKVFKKNDVVLLEIKHQGAPIINHGVIHTSSKNIVAVTIDLTSKNCEIECSTMNAKGEVGIYIGTNKTSLNLNKKVKRNVATVIEFPEFKGWYIFASNIGRYTLSICFIKKQFTNLLDKKH